MEILSEYSWLGWIIIGLLAGGLAKLIMPGKDPGGCIVTILLGIVGGIDFRNRPQLGIRAEHQIDPAGGPAYLTG